MTRLLVNENDWKSRVVETAKLFGWRYAHFRPARTKYGWVTPMEGDKGWLDLILLRPPRLILSELKVHREGTKAGDPEPEQAEWIKQLLMVPGLEVYVWRPEDWEEVYLTLAKDSMPIRRAM